MNKPNNAIAVVARRTGAVLLPDIDRVWTNRMQINGSTGNLYTVAMRRSDSTWGCSCPGWITHRNCKHLTAMLPALVVAIPGSRAAPRRVRG
jgi:hypothetical protein